MKEYRNQVVKVRFTEQEKQEVVEYCSKIGKPVSAILAELIKNSIRKEKNND